MRYSKNDYIRCTIRLILHLRMFKVYDNPVSKSGTGSKLRQIALPPQCITPLYTPLETPSRGFFCLESVWHGFCRVN